MLFKISNIIYKIFDMLFRISYLYKISYIINQISNIGYDISDI